MDAVIAMHKPLAARAWDPRPDKRPSAPALRPALQVAPASLVPVGPYGPGRVVLVAPHPDDEVLALGATLAQLCARGHAIHIYAVTDGEGSHPRSAEWTPDRLRSERPLETERALARLGIRATVERLGLPDGGVADHEKHLARRLQLRSDDTVFVTWRHDGHADHEACARATLAAARSSGAHCIEFPVWALVPGHAAHQGLRGRRMQQVVVSPVFAAAKQQAMAAFGSQLQADADTPPVLTPQALSVWRQPTEWLLA
ncbi:PIG-L deacetylase family protein [Xylophilus ampelinus]|uniref:LmbE family N-acetylglucosaminyl deacetylase n=1 Tax=Xylophilus ampelinus TaxID=54067 RepID=A0A318SD01_9BURK|nr:PIG-L family deacetylase [Xylophilus ampelinus]MCS4511695.1 PIG-L family deacetylase [Xylophilus ampelinus]PYE73797.1 LmbE family N-acetylglucosaminyl deacetylase [Xylophilus ampelinus]